MIFISWKREKREKKNETDKNHRPRPTLQFNSIKITLVASFYIGLGVVVLLSLILLTHSHEISGFPGDMADVKSWCKGLFVYPFVTGTLCTKTCGRKKKQNIKDHEMRCHAMRYDKWGLKFRMNGKIHKMSECNSLRISSCVRRFIGGWFGRVQEHRMLPLSLEFLLEKPFSIHYGNYYFKGRRCFCCKHRRCRKNVQHFHADMYHICRNYYAMKWSSDYRSS